MCLINFKELKWQIVNLKDKIIWTLFVSKKTKVKIPESKVLTEEDFQKMIPRQLKPDWALVGKGCKKCDGYGTLVIVVKNRVLPGYHEEEIQCPECEGSGKKQKNRGNI